MGYKFYSLKRIKKLQLECWPICQKENLFLLRPDSVSLGANAYTNVVKNHLEFTRAIDREEIKGCYTDRATKNCGHSQISIFSSQQVDTTIISRQGECSNGQEKASGGVRCD